jgi:hypothetical protein
MVPALGTVSVYLFWKFQLEIPVKDFEGYPVALLFIILRGSSDFDCGALSD